MDCHLGFTSILLCYSQIHGEGFDIGDELLKNGHESVLTALGLGSWVHFAWL
jgi:hypothetical protein